MHILLTSSTQLNGLSSCVQHTLAHPTRIINSVFHFHNAPENFKWSSSELRSRRWHYCDVRGKVTRGAGMNGMPSPLNLPTYYPKHIPTHISSFMKKNKIGLRRRAQKQSHILPVCWWWKLHWTEGAWCGQQRADNTAAVRLSATWWSECMFVFGSDDDDSDDGTEIMWMCRQTAMKRRWRLRMRISIVIQSSVWRLNVWKSEKSFSIYLHLSLRSPVCLFLSMATNLYIKRDNPNTA